MSDDTAVFPAGGGPDPVREDARRMQRVLDTYYGHRYRVDRIIGRGGMSTVWLAADGPDHDVAVKVLKPELTDDAEFRARFRAEAEAAETVHSPHVVETYDYGEVPDVDGTGVTYCFIVMEYVQGESLADILSREKTLPEIMALDLIAQAATGLQAIHDRGLVHRDIKPGNLMITADGVVKVTDFGIAKAASAVPLTRTGMVVGTAQYVSPEQAQGHNVGPSSDVYSLGVVGYEILAGRRPFSGDSTVSVALKHISTPAPEIPGEVSPAVRQLIGICLRKDPTARYADGGELAAATLRVRAGNMPPAPAALARTQVVPAPGPGGPGAVADAAHTRLARVTDPTNMGPAPRSGGPAPARPTGRKNPPPGAAVRAPGRSTGRPARKKSGAGWIWFAVLAGVAAVGVLVWAFTSGLGGSGGKAPSTTTVLPPAPVETYDSGTEQTPEVIPEDTPGETVVPVPPDDGGTTGTPTETDVTPPTETGTPGGDGGDGGTTGGGEPGGETGGGTGGNEPGGDTGGGQTGGGTGGGTGGQTGGQTGGGTGGGAGGGTGGQTGGGTGGGTGGNSALPVPGTTSTTGESATVTGAA